ncbi:MAG: hypothetical protein N2438_14355, partial [Limisphaera sp.]|nr:hypothetical protein [Limisphaera sp.]
NKSHAVAYSDLAWRAMWLKINHPEAFYCALLNIHLSDTEKLNAIREDMQARKIDMLPPDILRSQHVFVVERDNGRPAIRFGLGGIKNIGESQDFL